MWTGLTVSHCRQILPRPLCTWIYNSKLIFKAFLHINTVITQDGIGDRLVRRKTSGEETMIKSDPNTFHRSASFIIMKLDYNRDPFGL